MPNYGKTLSIHPLSIEAISPTWYADLYTAQGDFVSILCQSRLFLLPDRRVKCNQHACQYPSSVNRGYFSYADVDVQSIEGVQVSILCQSRLFLLPKRNNPMPESGMCIHPLSIEAISPTNEQQQREQGA